MQNTGVTVVATAGTPVALDTGLTSTFANCPVAIKALHTNTDLVYICYKGGDSSEGYHLSKDEELILSFVGTLNSIDIDAAVNGEGVAWSLLNW